MRWLFRILLCRRGTHVVKREWRTDSRWFGVEACVLCGRIFSEEA